MRADLFSLLSLVSIASAREIWTTPKHLQHEARTRTAAVTAENQRRHLEKRQLPASTSNYTTIQAPSGATVRYKRIDELGCETTPGVASYAGYVDINNSSTFFYFFEARNNASTAPITMWTNGGPGSDSAIGLFQELGPCSINEDLTPKFNPYAWNTYSNMLFISQPPGVGFSYVTKEDGSLSDDYAGVLTQSEGVDGRFPTANRYINTTDLAAVSAWNVIQVFYANLDSLDNQTDSKSFNLATESYGGHYGPAFFSYFYDQNEAIKNGTAQGIPLQMDSLLIINGIIDEYIQAPYYPVMATNNTYGIVAYNETVKNYAEFALNMDNGCLAQIEICRSVDISVFSGQSICAEAANMCRDNVEGVYYSYGGRGVYDIRHPIDDPTPPEYFADFLNLLSTQQILGVDLNYTEANSDIYFYFQNTGDFVYNEFLTDLQNILDNGVRVSLIYGDADYICNWFGGEAISKALNYTNAADFASAGYVPMTVNGTQYGETRQAGNFSFTRVYEAGHEVPYYAPEAALALFQRSIMGLSASDGGSLTASTISSGTANTTHTESFVPLPSSTTDSGASGMASASAVTSVAPYVKERRRVF